MALRINTNIASLNAQNQLGKSQSLSDQALQRLSSGLRINSAKDDAAGMAISTRFDTQIRGLTVAQRNANDGISMVQTAEGGLDEMVSNLQRIRELAVQAANGSNSEDDRVLIQKEATERLTEITRIAGETTFNGSEVLNGATDVVFQVGSLAGETIEVSFGEDAMDAAGLGVAATNIENLSASQALILDADFASESARMAEANVLQQAGISVLVQANARLNMVLSLLQ